ncbi:hypothetical protein ABZ832_11515 [Streptantibioticus parmotrematis]|uniref:hypothetical protein n=1 Tax=Streptantibioticus parmotrematis TaxID=2873249 RepID=UPI0033C6E3F3
MSAQETGRRVEEVLDRLAELGRPEASEAAEELVRVLMEFYGAGLARIVALLSSAPGGSLDPLLGDEVAAGLLVLHDLHPEDTAARVDRALAAADAGSLVVEEFDQTTGTLRLSGPAGGGCGCGGTADDTREHVEAALSCFAPEVVTVELAQAEAPPAEPVLLQIGTRPSGTASAGVR